jgi:predicted nuclease of predicted toxin-antitoxin system
MSLLLDQGLPRSTVQHLASLGIASRHVGDLGMATADDTAILAYAVQHSLSVVTLDADFHATLATTGASRPSVIRIRIEGLKGDALARLVNQVVQAAATEIAAGALVSVTPPNLVRIRLLPVV